MHTESLVSLIESLKQFRIDMQNHVTSLIRHKQSDFKNFYHTLLGFPLFLSEFCTKPCFKQISHNRNLCGTISALLLFITVLGVRRNKLIYLVC